MKALYCFVFLFFLCIVRLNGQGIIITKEDSKEIRFAFGISKIHEFGSQYVYLKILEYDMIGALPELEGQDLIVKDLYVYLKQRTDDTPTTENYFRIKGGFYNPRNFQFDAESKTLTFTYGTEKHPSELKLLMSTKEIKII